MSSSVYDVETFFAQLGLPNDQESIDHFLSTHYLIKGVTIDKALFWTPAQAAFIRQALADDANWAIVVDQIANLLSKNEPPPST